MSQMTTASKAVLLLKRSREVNGPWLLTREHLRQLDEVLKCIQNSFDEAVPEPIRKGAPASIKISIPLPNGNTLVASSLEEAFARDECKFASVSTFTGSVNNQFFRVHFGLYKSGLFDINRDVCGNNDAPVALQAVDNLERWAIEHKPSGVIRRWHSWFRTPLVILSIVAAVVLWMLIAESIIFRTNPTADSRYAAAKSILDEGVNVSNQAKAQELVLSYLSNYTPGPLMPPGRPVTYWVVLTLYLVSLVLAVILAPTTIVALSKAGDDAVAWKWKQINYGLYGIPAGVIVPYFVAWLKDISFGH